MKKLLERFEIVCPCIGLAGYTETKAAALALAKIVARRKHPKTCRILVHDRLAHYGQPDTWDLEGNICASKGEPNWSRAPEVTRDVLCQALRKAEESLAVAQKYAEVGGITTKAKALGKLVVDVHRLLAWAMALNGGNSLTSPQRQTQGRGEGYNSQDKNIINER